MAITANRVCGICGKKVGMISAIYLVGEMRDDCYLCSECTSKCSPYVSYSTIQSWTKQDALDHMAYMQEVRRRYETEFVVTDAIYKKPEDKEPAIVFDTTHGWWAIPEKLDIFTFDQVKEWEFDIDTYDGESSGIHFDYKPPKRSMPKPPKTEDFKKIFLKIRLYNHPYAEEASVQVNGSQGLLQGYRDFLDESYGNALKCYNLMEKYCSAYDGIITFYD